MMKPKKYKIASIDDICNVITEGNQEHFLEDVRLAFLAYLSMIESVKEKFPKECNGKKNTEIAGFTFTWIDDGQHDFKSAKITSHDGSGIEIKFKK